MSTILIFLFVLLILYSISGHISGIANITTISGFFIVVSFFLGKFLKKFAFPLITGYLISGIIFSPSVTGIIDEKLLSPHSFCLLLIHE